MDFEEIDVLRRSSLAWKLLRADNAPLVIGFLGRVFVEENARSVPAAELAALLDDELYALNERLGERTFPKAAKAYLDDWAAPDVGWMRKYYPVGEDEAHFDVTPAVEKALAWVKSVRGRPFVGTESRLNTVFDLLRQMVFGAETDTDVRLAELRRRRLEIDDEIARVEGGDVAVMDSAALRDRYQQFAATSRELLADFREVEANFRALDRELRERIAAWGGSKGELLDAVLGDRDAIAGSDQGRSFHAFYDFLLSQSRQEEFAGLLEKVQALEGIGETDPRLRRIHYDWLDAGLRTQSTVRLLSEQLRRFLDDRVWLENRRVMDILHIIETRALKLREHTASVPMERPMYPPRAKQALDSTAVTAPGGDVDVSQLFEQVHVDPALLAAKVRDVLRRRGQIGLPELVAEHPLELGLAELVTYLALADPDFDVVFDETVREHVPWTDADGRALVATVPSVTFARIGTGRR